MTFSKNFKLQVQTLKPVAKNRLVYGLLDVASKEQFDLPTFKEIITELNREYETTASKLQELRTDVSDTVIKDVLGAKIASENLFDYVCNRLGNIFRTNPNSPEIIQLEEIILNNLARLTKYANDIISQEIYLENLMRNKSFLERIRDSTTIKKIVITLALITAFKGQNLKPFDANTYNNRQYNIETQTKINSANNTINNATTKLVTENSLDYKNRIMSKNVNFNMTSSSNIINNIVYNIDIPSEVLTRNHIRALIWVESNDNPYVKSRAGATGLMQLMPAAWTDYGEGSFEENSTDIKKNIRAGVKLLIGIEKYCKNKHPNWDNLSPSDKADIILAAYNCGPNKLRKKNWNINFNQETKNHIKKLHAILY